MFKCRSSAFAVLAVAVAAVFALPASSASAGSATVPNACANSATSNFSQMGVTTSGDDGLTTVAPGGTTATSGLSQSAAIPGDTIFVAGYNLGLLQQGTNNIPANVRSTIEATNTVEGVQNTNTVGGSPPDGSMTVPTTITDPDGVRGTGDETSTDPAFSVAYDDMNWTVGAGGTINYRQDSIAAAPPTAANNTLLINTLIDGFLNVAFRCAPGTVTPPNPGTITLIDPAPSFDSTQILGHPTANAGPDQTVTEGTLVALDGTASSGPAGEALTFVWTQTGVPAVTLSDPTSPTPTFTAPEVPADTPLTFTLEVCDEPNPVVLCDTDTVVVTVQDREPFEHPPVANAGPDQTVLPGTTVNLDGTASFDPAGQPLTYMWTAAAGITLIDPTSPTPTFTAPDVATTTPFAFTLAVCDVVSLCNTDTVVVTVVGRAILDAAGIVFVNGPVSSTKTSKSFVFKVTNVGTSPITINESDITSSVDVNGTPTGSVTVSPFTKTLNPGASTRVKLVWSYAAGALATGDSVVFQACVNVAFDIDTFNDCDSASATAK